MFSKPFRRIAVAGGVILAASGAVGAIAVASEGSSHRTSGGSLSPQAAGRARSNRMVVRGPRRVLPAVLVRSFGVFRAASSGRARAAAGAADQFPGVPTDMASNWGLAVGDATAIPNSTGLDIWVVPGNTGTCFAWRNPSTPTGSGGDCVPNGMTLAGELSPYWGLPGGEIVVMGLAPDGNTAVKLTRPDGSAQSVTVSHNVYVAQAPQGFKTVTLRDSQGVLVSRGVGDGR